MAPALRLSVEQTRRALKLARGLAHFCIALNDVSPIPPDANHRAMEAWARSLLTEMEPRKLIRPKRP